MSGPGEVDVETQFHINRLKMSTRMAAERVFFFLKRGYLVASILIGKGLVTCLIWNGSYCFTYNFKKHSFLVW